MAICIHQITEYVGEGEWVCNECKTYFETEERLWVLVGNQEARIEALEVQVHSRNECVSDLEARIDALGAENARLREAVRV